jgi:hypothetical protein
MGNLTSWNHLGHSRPVTGLLYLYFIKVIERNNENFAAFKGYFLGSSDKPQ